MLPRRAAGSVARRPPSVGCPQGFGNFGQPGGVCKRGTTPHDVGMSDQSFDFPTPAVTVDMAAFCLVDGAPRLLLVRRGRPPFEGAWALPGGFIDVDEPLEDAARREFHEETGLEAGDVAQMHTFGAPGRDPRGRTISVVYLAYLPGEPAPRAGDDAAEAGWFSAAALPSLAFDHAAVAAMAFENARRHYGMDARAFTP